jgi:hypothetical protein
MRYRGRLLRCAASGVASLGMLLASRAGAQQPALGELLSRAGTLTVALEDRLAVIAATEEYQQGLLLSNDVVARVRRRTVSDVVWMPTGDAMVWAFFRDVLSVDGSAVVDRAKRLEGLFVSGATLDARRQAGQLLDESTRYNLGRRRTVNTPAFALSILHPRNQSRFRFGIAGETKRDGIPGVKVRFYETARPTLTRTSRGADVPARGILWIEPAQGALVESELRLDAPRRPTEIKVRYRLAERLEAWLPIEMEEAYGNRSRSPGEERVEAIARYSDFRKAEAEVQVILPTPSTP